MLSTFCLPSSIPPLQHAKLQQHVSHGKRTLLLQPSAPSASASVCSDARLHSSMRSVTCTGCSLAAPHTWCHTLGRHAGKLPRLGSPGANAACTTMSTTPRWGHGWKSGAYGTRRASLVLLLRSAEAGSARAPACCVCASADDAGNVPLLLCCWCCWLHFAKSNLLAPCCAVPTVLSTG